MQARLPAYVLAIQVWRLDRMYDVGGMGEQHPIALSRPTPRRGPEARCDLVESFRRDYQKACAIR